MKTIINGQQFFIGFKFDNPVTPTQTSCIIKGENKEVVKEATVKRYHKDLPSKEVARKFALTAAIKDFSRAERAQFWMAYLNRGKA